LTYDLLTSNKICARTQKSCSIHLPSLVMTSPVVVLLQSALAQYNRNTSFLQLLQVACKFSASCRKLVLQHCIVGVCTSAIQLQYKKKILVLHSCSVAVLHLYRPLYALIKFTRCAFSAFVVSWVTGRAVFLAHHDSILSLSQECCYCHRREGSSPKPDGKAAHATYRLTI